MKLPKETAKEKEDRDAAMEEGLKTAVSYIKKLRNSKSETEYQIFQVGVPLSLAKRSNSIWDTLLDLAECGNINCKSDLQVKSL